ncbi:MAG TPA: TonB-dependent receptor [Candidatus Eisenbacteria bacterium]|nr:TonB-dependent receptor [Candidatus Eisenbacteria bacterium]
MLAIAGGVARAEDDPFSLVREEQTVTGAAKRPQPLSETPSAVTVITAEEIRVNGYHTLADALRWVRGVYVTYDRNYSYVGVRGLQRPGDYNNKVLLTLDGHAMNGNVFGDGLFGGELGLDMETIERIEVVRGPGSALYGSNAVLAVVNVVTRRPSRENGVTLSGRAGGHHEGRAFASMASSRPGRPEWALSGSWLSAAGADLYFPEFDAPVTHGGIARNADEERAASVLGRAEWHGLRLTARFNERMKRIPTGAFSTTFGDRRSRTYDGRDFVELAGSRQLSPEFELHGRAYWDGARYRGYYIYGPDSATYVNYDRGDGDIVGTEWRGHWSPHPRHVVTFGAVGELHPRARMVNFDIDPYYLYVDSDRHSGVIAGYLEDEQRIGRRAILTAGSRVDRYPGFDPVFSPRADLVVHPTPRLTWKLLAGAAFRAPSRFERDYVFDDVIANPALGPERVRTLETELLGRLGPATLTLSAYRNRVLGLIDFTQIDTVGTLQYQNRDRVRSQGIEGEAELVWRGGTRARLGVACQRSDIVESGAELSNSPRWNGHLVVTHAPVDGRLSLGLGVRCLSPRLTLAGQRTATATVADARVGVRVGRSVNAGFEARNLFDHRYGDPGSEEHVGDQILQDGRAFYATLTLRPTFER